MGDVIRIDFVSHHRLTESAQASESVNLGHVLQDCHDMLPAACKKLYRVCDSYMELGLDNCHNCPLYEGE